MRGLTVGSALEPAGTTLESSEAKFEPVDLFAHRLEALVDLPDLGPLGEVDERVTDRVKNRARRGRCCC
jgi:hypothetical protein